ncbi:MAG: ABC transporter substrate-binding protein, partial [Pseudomonadota bacterium]
GRDPCPVGGLALIPSFRGVGAAGGRAAAALAPPAGAAEKLKLAVGQKGLWDTAMPYLGAEKGFFREAGLELDIVWTDGGADTQQAIVSGSIDIGIGIGILGVIGAWGKNAPIAIISAEMTGSNDIFWYVKADSPIRGVKDLKGKTMAFSRPGSSSNLIAAELVKAAGIDARLVPAGGMAATLTQVMSGQIDAGWSAVPVNLNLVEDGKIRVIAVGNDAPGVATQTVRVNVAHTPFLNKNRDAMRRFIKAYQRTIDWAYAGPEVLGIYAKLAEVAPALADQVRTAYLPKAALALDKIGNVELSVQQAVDAKRLEKPLTAEQVKEMLRHVAELAM